MVHLGCTVGAPRPARSPHAATWAPREAPHRASVSPRGVHGAKVRSKDSDPRRRRCSREFDPRLGRPIERTGREASRTSFVADDPHGAVATDTDVLRNNTLVVVTAGPVGSDEPDLPVRLHHHGAAVGQDSDSGPGGVNRNSRPDQTRTHHVALRPVGRITTITVLGANDPCVRQANTRTDRPSNQGGTFPPIAMFGRALASRARLWPALDPGQEKRGRPRDPRCRGATSESRP